MNLGLTLIFLVVVAPRPAVYVKGHSRAAEKVRTTLADLTCYRSGAAPETSSAMLHVDHVHSKSGRSWLVMYLTDDRRKVLWEGKGEEYAWPIPSPLNGLLKSLAKATCTAYQTLPIHKAPPPQSRLPVAESQSFSTVSPQANPVSSKVAHESSAVPPER